MASFGDVKLSRKQTNHSLGLPRDGHMKTNVLGWETEGRKSFTSVCRQSDLHLFDAGIL